MLSAMDASNITSELVLLTVIAAAADYDDDDDNNNNYYYYYYLLQLSFYSVAVVLTLVTNKSKYTYKKQHKNTVHTSTHITKTPTQLSEHPHITKPTHTHTHIYTHPYITKQVKTTTVQDTHRIQ
jgi:hypothetical protein